ncbi:MAG: hypothetical protein ACKPKO_06570, partial [Candidatus Fonsibacter sp.]
VAHDDPANSALRATGAQHLVGPLELIAIAVKAGLLRNHTHAGQVLMGRAYGCQTQCMLGQVINELARLRVRLQLVNKD